MNCSTTNLLDNSAPVGAPEWFRDPAALQSIAPTAAPDPQQEPQELRDRIVAYLDANPTVGMDALARGLADMGITISGQRISVIWGDYHPEETRQFEEDQFAAALARDEERYPERHAAIRKEIQDMKDYIAQHGEAPQPSPQQMSRINAHIRANRGTYLPHRTKEERAAAWAAWEEECAGPLDKAREAELEAWNAEVVQAWEKECDRDEC